MLGPLKVPDGDDVSLGEVEDVASGVDAVTVEGSDGGLILRDELALGFAENAGFREVFHERRLCAGEFWPAASVRAALLTGEVWKLPRMTVMPWSSD